MRSAFVKALCEIAEKDERVLLLTADLGFMVIEPFAKKFPKRFINVGVAEQNMVGIATGLAEAGYIPYVYSIAPFAALRPYEFIRNGPVQHHLPVRVIGVGGGFDYGHNGLSHYALEDIGVMRLQPGMTVIAPADRDQADQAIRETWNLPGPAYFRFSKDGRVPVTGLKGEFKLGRAQTVRPGKDILIIALGEIVLEAEKAAEILAKKNISAEVMLVSCVSPAPVEDLANALKRFPAAFTVEVHYLDGGFGSMVAEVVADRGINCRLQRHGVAALPDGHIGTKAFLQHRHSLSGEALAACAEKFLAKLQG